MTDNRWLRAVSVWLCMLFPVLLKAQADLHNAIRVQLDALRRDPADAEALRSLCFLYLNKADYEQAIAHGQRLFELGYARKEYNRAVIYAHICLGQAYMMTGQPEEAYRHLGQARLIGEEHENDSALCSVYNGLGLYASNVQKDYYRSLEYFFKGVEAARRSRYERLYSILLSNISGIYYLKKDTTGSRYAQECYERGHERKDPFLIYCGATTTAYMHYLRGAYEEAFRYIREAEFLMQQNDFYDRAHVYNLFGYILHRMGRTDEAVLYFRKSLELQEPGNTSSIVSALLGYAGILMERRQYDRAVRQLEEGLALSRSRQSTIYRSDLLDALARCHEARGSLTEALHYRRLYQAETDSLYSAEKERAVGEIRAKYELERHENESKQQRLELLKKENRLQLLMAGLVCILVTGVLLYILYRRKDRLYRTIVRQQQEAIRQEQQLRRRIMELSAAIPPSTELFSPAGEKYAASSLTDEKKRVLFVRLETLLQEQRIYTDNLLTKEKVAEMLDTNRTYLSQIINEQTKQNFTQFVNGFRTKEAVRLLSDPACVTPLKALCVELGFNSMTTFYSQFQAATGMTPAQYRNKVQEMQEKG